MSYPVRSILFFFALTLAQAVHSQEIREFMDLQIHPTMHIAHPVIGQGLLYFDEASPPKLTYRHTLTNVNYANFLEQNKDMRIIIHGAIVPEVFTNRKKAREMILEELQYFNDFAATNSDKFVVAKTPQEVRHYVHNTDKTVIIHSVEGAEFLINSQEDADFWAEQGIAYMTLIHLVNNRLGGAATLPGVPTAVINFRGSCRAFFHGPDRTKGLTEKGKQVILWMANAGMMIDITHMSPRTRSDALAFMEANNIPPLATHDGFQPIQNTQRGIPMDEVVKIYENGGLMSLGIALEAYKPFPEYQAKLDSMKGIYCNGSIDSYRFTYQELNRFIEQHLDSIFDDDQLQTFTDLTEEQKVDISVGFQSDFNGWLDHARPRVGKEGCFEMEEGKTYHPMDTVGMAHPGMMPLHWDYLRKQGVDLEPILRASEKFLQMWEFFLERKGQFQAAVSDER